jgi:predicted RNA-binding Zn ribbon-like protein
VCAPVKYPLPVQLLQQNYFYWYRGAVQSVAEMPFIAGNVALDFVNTAEERGHPDADDALRTVDDLRLWGERRGVISGAADGDGDGWRLELAAAVEARELLYELFRSQMLGQRGPAASLARLARLASTAYQAGRLDQAADGRLSWSWDPSRLDTVRHVAVASAVELLSASPTARLKQCPGEHCGWLFLDTTKRGNRRWCSMSECGQDAKSARRRERSISHLAGQFMMYAGCFRRDETHHRAGRDTRDAGWSHHVPWHVGAGDDACTAGH